MLDAHEIEDILDRFRDWLTTVSEDLAQTDVRALAERLTHGSVEPSNGSVGLLQVTETLTALRHEVKLESKSLRSLRETTEMALEGLHRAAEQFEACRKDATLAAEQAVRPFIEKLLMLDELIGQAASFADALESEPEAPIIEQLRRELESRFETLPRWRRIAAANWHHIVCAALINRTSSAGKQNGLVEGLRLLKVRAAEALTAAGLERIECLGKPVDPTSMRVVDVTDAPGPPPETVVADVRPGYMFHGKVIRCAEVRATPPLRPTT